MKHLHVWLLLFFITITYQTYAQSPLVKGEKQLDFGVASYDIDKSVYGGIDFGIINWITVGAEATAGKNHVYFGGNANFHFDEPFELSEKFNVYGGVRIGYISSDLLKDDGMRFGAQIGGRYFFTDQLGANFEFQLVKILVGPSLGVTYIL